MQCVVGDPWHIQDCVSYPDTTLAVLTHVLLHCNQCVCTHVCVVCVACCSLLLLQGQWVQVWQAHANWCVCMCLGGLEALESVRQERLHDDHGVV